MKDWINRHLNWTLIIFVFVIVYPIGFIAYGILAAIGSSLDPGNFGYAFGQAYFIFIVPLFCIYIMLKKGRSGWWILLYPLTGILIPLFLLNKKTGQWQRRVEKDMAKHTPQQPL